MSDPLTNHLRFTPCAGCGNGTAEGLCRSCQEEYVKASPLPVITRNETKLCPALTFSAWQTAHYHLNFAHAKIEQARELLALTGEAGRLCVQLENVATWLDDTAIRVTGQAVEAARL